MRSVVTARTCPAAGAAPPRRPGRRPGRSALAATLLAVLAAAPAAPRPDFGDEPLLPSEISTRDVELRGRYVRQWRQPDGTLVLLYNGDFRLDAGPRRLRARDAVIWITPRRDAPDRPKYYELTVYLAGSAEVHELAGTVVVDSVLLVRGLRTAGRIIKYQDARAEESLEDSPLYQRALRDRLAVERGAGRPEVTEPEVTRPAEAAPPAAAGAGRVIRIHVKNIEPAQTPAGEPVFVSTGGVYFSQAGGPDAPLLEIRADTAVIFPARDAAETLFGEEPPPEASGPQDAAAPQPPRRPPPPEEGAPRPRREEAPGGPGLDGGGLERRLRGVYLEGDVVLSLGTRFVRAARLYYDFEHDRAVILDAVFRADIPQREIPLYVRADEIRQLSAREFAAEHARVSTSEFYTPSYHVGAERIRLRDLTVRDSAGRARGPVSGAFELWDSTLNVGGVPLLWWPYSQGRLEASETLIRRVRSGYSGDFGYEFESAWYLFNLLGLPAPEGYDATLRLDYFSRRGPALGIDSDYARDDHYGLLRSYFLYDDGADTLGPLRRAEEDPATATRGRVLWRHRHFLPEDWEVTLETAYLSDEHFLEEFEKSEFFEGKDQETLVYLKRARGVQALTLLTNWRLHDFLTQTEHLPELTYRRIGDTLWDRLVLYHESRIGGVRYRPADVEPGDLPFHLYEHRYTGLPGRRGAATDLTFRGDIRQEAELPLRLGALNVVPFGSVRGTYWDGQPLGGGGLWRGLGVYGLRGGTSFSRVYDGIESELLDIHRIRHVVKPDFAAWWSHSNTRSGLATPFDYGIETVDDFYGATAGLRQVWQTRRGAGDRQRSVDLLTLNLEVGFFGNTDGRTELSNGYANPLRPENSRARNYLGGDLIYRLSDTTSLLYDFNVDLDDWASDRQNLALAVERSPRLAYLVGTRYAGDIDLSLVGGGWNYRLTEKHITAVRSWFDLDSGDLGEIAATYIRKLPRWYLGLNFEYDNIDDDFTISVSLWPEGIPEWTLGSRRFTGLATSTGIRP